MVPVAIRSSDGDMLIEPRCVRHVSLDRICRLTLRFPPQGPPGRVPLLHQYYQSATTPCCHPAALRFLRLAVPRLHSLLSLLGGRVRRQGLELVTRYLRPGIRRGANRVLPSSWRISIVRLHMFQSDAGRTACTRPLQCSSVALEGPSAKAPTTGLSTLNSMAFGLAVYACMLVLSSKLIVCFRFAGVRKTLFTLRFDLFAKIVSSTL